jgi:hypothetical protein
MSLWGISAGLASGCRRGAVALAFFAFVALNPWHKSLFCPWAGFPQYLHFMEVFLLYASLYGAVLEKLS